MSTKRFFLLSVVVSFVFLAGCKIRTDGWLQIGMNNQTITTPAGDVTAPVLAEVAAIGLVHDNNQPTYTFNTTEDGDISYQGDCSSSQTQALAGDNTITFTALAWDKAYSNCKIIVTDAAGNASTALSVSTFRIIKTVTLNDTGITTCGDYSVYDTDPGTGVSQNTLDCFFTAVTLSDRGYDYSDGGPDPDIVPSGQDALYGRDSDAATNQNTDGDAGFSFTKLDAAGNALAASASNWSCVRDEVTGLVWQYHQAQAGDTFTWYNSDASSNGGVAGAENDATYGNHCTGYNSADPLTYCNTQAYTKRVNDSALCGLTDWRLPHKAELQSISHKGKNNPAIDTDYFPDTQTGDYWTATSQAGNSSSVIKVRYVDTSEYDSPKSYDYHVRLVSGHY